MPEITRAELVFFFRLLSIPVALFLATTISTRVYREKLHALKLPLPRVSGARITSLLFGDLLTFNKTNPLVMEAYYWHLNVVRLARLLIFLLLIMGWFVLSVMPATVVVPAKDVFAADHLLAQINQAVKQSSPDSTSESKPMQAATASLPRHLVAAINENMFWYYLRVGVCGISVLTILMAILTVASSNRIKARI